MSNQEDSQDSYGTDYAQTTRLFSGQQNSNMLASSLYVTEGQPPHLQQTNAYAPVQQHYQGFGPGYSSSPYAGTYNISPYDSQWSSPAVPQITSFSPQKGSATTRLQVWLHTQSDLGSYSNLSFVINFRERSANALFTKVAQHDYIHHYVLTADAPLLNLTSGSETIRLTLQMHDNTGREYPSLVIGDFLYEQFNRPVSRSPAAQITSRKRRLSQEPSQPAKRHTSSYVDARPKIEPVSRASMAGAQTRLADPLPPLPDQTYSTLPASTRSYVPSAATSYMTGSYLQASNYDYGTSAAGIDEHQNIHRQLSPSKLPSKSSYRTLPRRSQSPQHRASGQISRPLTVPISSDAAEPQLIRTSTLQSTNEGYEGGTGPRSFHPYHMYPSRAILKIDGDLDDMATNWTAEEMSTQRRLVEFQRSQQGNVITTSFKPVTLEGRAPNSICINCIWWENRGEAYITSVDTIYLLESLVAARFTVEEKNRIRRNLEGFRPLTVAKGKPESDDFFKLIMGFPNPRPRNIEKDVKAFPWRILSEALKKIISKYSASYSTPPMNMQPPAMTPSYSLGSAVSDETSRPNAVSSPRLLPISRGATMHPGILGSQALSPTVPGTTPSQQHHGRQSSSTHPHETHYSQPPAGISQVSNASTHEPRLHAAQSLHMQSPLHFQAPNWMPGHHTQPSSQQHTPTPTHTPSQQFQTFSQQQQQPHQTQPHPQVQQQQQVSGIPPATQQHHSQRVRQPSDSQYLRPSWDYTNFIETSPTLSATPSAILSGELAGNHSVNIQRHSHASQPSRAAEAANSSSYFTAAAAGSGVSASREASHAASTPGPPTSR